MPRKSKDADKIKRAVTALMRVAKQQARLLIQAHKGPDHMHAAFCDIASVYRVAVLLDNGQFQKAHDLAERFGGLNGYPNRPVLPGTFWELFEE